MTCELLLGDCLEVMGGMPDGCADAVVTDPPYTAAGGSTNGRCLVADSQFFVHWFRAVLAEVKRLTKPDGCAFIFTDWRMIGPVATAMTPPTNQTKALAWVVSQALVWDRESIGLGSPFRNSFEMIAFARGPQWSSELARDIPTVLRYRHPYGRHEFHGSEKPVPLCRQLIRWALPAGGVVLDPFMGSGSIGVAAAEEGCGFIGIEHEPAYHEISARRIDGARPDMSSPPLVRGSAAGQLDLFRRSIE